MELNKDDILKNINSFFGADNELAIKEAEHQIKIFEVIFEKEVEEYQKSKSKEIANPEKDSKNIKIIKSIKLFREDLKRKKDKRKIEEKKNTEIKKQVLKEFETLILSGKIRHGGDPVLRWMMSNVVLTLDPAGNVKPNKAKSNEKIDGIVACIMALSEAMENKNKGGSAYDDKEIFFI